MNRETRLHSLLISPLPAAADNALQHIATMIDLADDLGNQEALDKALELSLIVETMLMDDSQRCFLFFYRGNAYSALRKHRYTKSPEWLQWELSEIEGEILNFRKALHFAKEDQCPVVLRCKILTNLAIALNYAGRFVEAIPYYNLALAVDPCFAMALGNRGYATFCYARALFDTGHQSVFLKKAHEDLSTACQGTLEEGANPFFEGVSEHIASRVKKEFLQKPFSFKPYALGRSAKEQSYRKWCLNLDSLVKSPPSHPTCAY